MKKKQIDAIYKRGSSLKDLNLQFTHRAVASYANAANATQMAHRGAIAKKGRGFRTSPRVLSIALETTRSGTTKELN